MLLLADENIPGLVVDKLRSQGSDVFSIREIAPGSPDVEVINLAKKKNEFF